MEVFTRIMRIRATKDTRASSIILKSIRYAARNTVLVYEQVLCDCTCPRLQTLVKSSLSADRASLCAVSASGSDSSSASGAAEAVLGPVADARHYVHVERVSAAREQLVVDAAEAVRLHALDRFVQQLEAVLGRRRRHVRFFDRAIPARTADTSFEPVPEIVYTVQHYTVSYTVVKSTVESCAVRLKAKSDTIIPTKTVILTYEYGL